jgi:hypothetical protein
VSAPESCIFPNQTPVIQPVTVLTELSWLTPCNQTPVVKPVITLAELPGSALLIKPWSSSQQSITILNELRWFIPINKTHTSSL